MKINYFNWNEGEKSNEWGNPYDVFHHSNPSVKTTPRHFIVDNMSNREGYYGNPSSFMDISEPRVAMMQKKYEENNRNNFRKNIELVASLVNLCVVMPPHSIMMKCVEKMKKIANSH